MAALSPPPWPKCGRSRSKKESLLQAASRRQFRSLESWRRHPQGQALASESLIGHELVGEVAPRRRAEAELPAAGVRVLDLTRVIAGPVCTRFLAEVGADVLRVDPPGHPDMERGVVADSLLGKRSAMLDLSVPEGVGTLHDLLDRADVVVCGYRPGSLEQAPTGIAAGATVGVDDREFFLANCSTTAQAIWQPRPCWMGFAARANKAARTCGVFRWRAPHGGSHRRRVIPMLSPAGRRLLTTVASRPQQCRWCSHGCGPTGKPR